MREYLALIEQGGAVTIVILALTITVALIIVALKLSSKYKKRRPVDATAQEEELPTGSDESEAPVKKKILGTGKYQCMAIRPGNIVDFTTIPEALGEMYTADPSCPMSGGLFIVRELPDGKVVDYDPRAVPIVIEQSPEHAWFATNWRIVSEVYGDLGHWWQSLSNWYAAAMLVIVFIVGLVVVGG